MKNLLPLWLLIANCAFAQHFDWVSAGKSDSGHQYAYAITVDKNNYLYALALNSATTTYGVHQVNPGFCVVVHDPAGTAVSAASISFSPSLFAADELHNLFFSGTFTGNIGVPGYTYSSNGEEDSWLLKTDQYGVIKWLSVFSSSGKDIITSLKPDPAGNIYVAGWFSGPTFQFNNDTLFNPNKNSGFVAKIKHDGTTDWANTAHQSATVNITGVVSLTLDKYDQPVTLSIGHNCDSCDAYFVSRFTSGGSVADHKLLFADTGYVYSPGEHWNLKTDDLDNIYIQSSGYRYSLGSISKYSKDLKRIWLFNLGVTGCRVYSSWDVDMAGNIYMAQQHLPSGGYCSPPVASSSEDVIIIKKHPDLSTAWEKTVLGKGHEQVRTLVTDRMGNCYFSGTFNGSNQYHPGLFGETVSFDGFTFSAPHQFSQMYAAKIGNQATGILQKNTDEVLIRIYPNPSEGIVHIESGENLIHEISITDLTGKVIQTIHPFSTTTDCDIKALAPGIYLVKTTMNDKRCATTKLCRY